MCILDDLILFHHIRMDFHVIVDLFFVLIPDIIIFPQRKFSRSEVRPDVDFFFPRTPRKLCLFLHNIFFFSAKKLFQFNIFSWSFYTFFFVLLAKKMFHITLFFCTLYVFPYVMSIFLRLFFT